ncbi:MAG: PilZ domain-containing protein [Nitrospirae bacterium]|nr:PilZ domain-containing protein [Candidatus Troglogloeales bacterium]
MTSSANVLFGNHSIKVTIGNISLSGVLFHSDHQFGLGEIISIIFKGVYQKKRFNESVLGKIVTVSRKESGNLYGLQFSTYLVSEQQPFLTTFVNRTRGKGISFLRNPLYSRAERI